MSVSKMKQNVANQECYLDETSVKVQTDLYGLSQSLFCLSTCKKGEERERLVMTTFVDSFHLKENEQSHK